MLGSDAMGLNRRGGRTRGYGLLALGLVVALAGCGNREVRLEGERFDTRVPLVATLTGAGAAASGPEADVARAINLPAASTYAAWAQRGFDAQNRTPHASLSANLTQVWSTNIGSGNSRRNRLTADPVAGSGAVFTLDSTAGVRAHSVCERRASVVGGPDGGLRPGRRRLGRGSRA
jgi:outer membrane protein assembly factor BamB